MSTDVAWALRTLASDPHHEESWEALYYGHYPWLVAHAFRRLRGDAEEAREAVQATFVRLIRYADFSKIRDTVAFKSYALTVLLNVIRKQRGDLSRERTESLAALDVEDPTSLDFSDLLALREALALVAEDLSPDELALLRGVCEGRTRAEIGAQLEISPGAVSVRLSRLRQKLGQHPLLQGTFPTGA